MQFMRFYLDVRQKTQTLFRLSDMMKLYYDEYRELWLVNSHAVGMAVALAYGFENDFVINTFSELAALFFVTILEFISTQMSEIKIHEKIP